MAVAQSEVEQTFSAGDERALSVAYNMWGALVYTVARRGADSAEIASEITQRTFLSVWNGGGASSGLDLKSRLILTARTLVHQYLDSTGANRERHVAADDVIDRVVARDELTGLAEPGRSIVVQAIGEGMGPQQLARGDELPAAAVADLIRDGVLRMAAGLAGSRGV